MSRSSRKKKQPGPITFSDPHDILMNAPVGIFTSTPEGRYISANPALARMYGYDSPEELIESVTDIAGQVYVDPADRKDFIRLMKEQDEVVNHESRRLRRDGAIFWVSMNARAVRDEEGRIVACQGFATDISDRKLAEQRERVSEERFRLMFMNAPMPYQSLDEQGNFLDVNQTFLDVLGYSRGELIGRNFSDILHPDWVDHFRENFPRFKAVGEVLGVEFEMVKSDGTTILVFFNGKIQRDNQGEFIRTHCIFQDITEQKRIEKQLNITLKKAEEGRQTLEALMENIPMGITIADKDLRLKRVSRHGLEMMGWAKERHLGLSVEQIISEWDVYLADGVTKACLEQLPLPRAIMNGETVFGQEIVQRHADGRTIPLNCDAGPIRDSQGRITGGIVAWQDMTGRKRAEEALRLAYEHLTYYRHAVDSMGDYKIAVVDENYCYRIVSSQYMKGYGLAESDIVGKSVADLMGVDVFKQSVKPNLDKALKGQTVHYVGWFEIPNKGRNYLEVSYYPIMSMEQTTSCVVALIRDITERKRAEEERDKLQSQLLQAQKMESVGVLAGGIAHDFNNLLHIMGGNLELLDMKMSEDHPGKKRVRTIRKSMDRAAQLVRQMLQFSRKAEAKRQDMDINHQVKEAAEMLERTIPKMISIELSLDKETRFINADPIQVEQILLNLGNNAADAMPDGGRLIIETSNVDVDEALASEHTGLKKGEYVLLRVSDTGCGMDEETLDKVFDPFFTTKEVGKGTGLGLASAYGIVKAHDGYITCQSRPGKGTAFKVYWPAAEQG